MKEIEILLSMFHKKKDWIITLTIMFFRMRKKKHLNLFSTFDYCFKIKSVYFTLNLSVCFFMSLSSTILATPLQSLLTRDLCFLIRTA